MGYTLYKGSVWTSPNTNCVGVPADSPKDEQNETVWGTYTCPFELMAPGMWAEGEPNNDNGADPHLSMGDGISVVPTGASMTSCAAMNSTPSSASFPVKTEETHHQPSKKTTNLT